MTRVLRKRIEGIAEPLPADESVLWSGRPDLWRFARRQCRLNWVAGWFLALIVWRGYDALHEGAGLATALSRASTLLLPAAAALILLAWLGTSMARNTTYAVTARRIVIHTGVALPVTFNLPVRFVDGVDVRECAGSVVEVMLTVGADCRPSTLALWPHVRGGRDGRQRPLFRDLPAAHAQALLPVLTSVLRASDADQPAGRPQPVIRTEPRGELAGGVLA